MRICTNSLNKSRGALFSRTAYTLRQQRSTDGVKRIFTVRSTFLIDKQGKIARIWPKVNVKGHVAEVLTAVKSF